MANKIVLPLLDCSTLALPFNLRLIVLSSLGRSTLARLSSLRFEYLTRLSLAQSSELFPLSFSIVLSLFNYTDCLPSARLLESFSLRLIIWTPYRTLDYSNIFLRAIIWRPNISLVLKLLSPNKKSPPCWPASWENYSKMDEGDRPVRVSKGTGAGIRGGGGYESNLSEFACIWWNIWGGTRVTSFLLWYSWKCYLTKTKNLQLVHSWCSNCRL